MQMAAVTVAYPLGQIVVGLGLLFGNGAAAYLSRLLGQDDRKTANAVAGTALYSSIGIGAIAILLSLFFLQPILRQFGALADIMPYALSYSRIYITFSIFNVFNVAMNNIVSSEGAARTAMLALMSGAVLNVILDPIFIYTLGLGVAGAAIATALSQMVSSAIYITLYPPQKKRIYLSHQRMPLFRRHFIGDTEDRRSNPAVSITHQHFHRHDQRCRQRVRRFRPCGHGPGHENPVHGNPDRIRFSEGLPAHRRLQLRGQKI